MKISTLLRDGRPHLSFEIFPPKTDDSFASVMGAAEQIARLSPAYMSVTYGAGGTTAGYTAEVAGRLLTMGVTPLAHLTCISATREQVEAQLDVLHQKGVENILALRGDIPAGYDPSTLFFPHASHLMREVARRGDFCIGGACYPESHPESQNSQKDIDSLRLKMEAGCEFLVTQMYFDNHILYNFLWRLQRAGVTIPVVAGVMPVTAAKQIRRICAISGTALPQPFVRIVDRYGDDPAAMKQAGIIYASQQIIDLFANGVNAVHVYSMNKPDVAAAIMQNVSHILG